MRPGSSCAIKDHRLAPKFPTRLAILSSSCSGTASGLSRMYVRTTEQLDVAAMMMSPVRSETEPPSYLTSLVQGPFTSSGFKTFCQRCRHCTSVLSSKYSAAKTANIVDTRGKTGTKSRGLLLQSLQLEIMHISRLIERAAYRLASSFCHHDDAQLSAAARPASQAGERMNVYSRCP